jgi:hypothetical protein
MSTSTKLLGMKRNIVSLDEIMQLFFKNKHQNYMKEKLFFSDTDPSKAIIQCISIFIKIKSKYLLELIFEYLQSSEVKLIHNDILNRKIRLCSKNVYLR